MKLIIEIDEGTYNAIRKRFGKPNRDNNEFFWIETVRKGIPLPKGHGRLIDADAFIEKLQSVSERQRYKDLLIGENLTVDDVFNAIIESLKNEGLAEGDSPTIIPADGEEEQKWHLEK